MALHASITLSTSLAWPPQPMSTNGTRTVIARKRRTRRYPAPPNGMIDVSHQRQCVCVISSMRLPGRGAAGRLLRRQGPFGATPTENLAGSAVHLRGDQSDVFQPVRSSTPKRTPGIPPCVIATVRRSPDRLVATTGGSRVVECSTVHSGAFPHGESVNKAPSGQPIGRGGRAGCCSCLGCGQGHASTTSRMKPAFRTRQSGQTSRRPRLTATSSLHFGQSPPTGSLA